MTCDHPRRITPPSPPGALLKRAPEDQPRTRRSDAGRDDPDYLAIVRQLPCLKCGMEPAGEAAHVRLASAAFGKSSGMQKTPDDKWALPLCRADHLVAPDAQHKQSELQFWAELGINPLITATRLYAKRGDYVAMHFVIVTTIAERDKR